MSGSGKRRGRPPKVTAQKEIASVDNTAEPSTAPTTRRKGRPSNITDGGRTKDQDNVWTSTSFVKEQSVPSLDVTPSNTGRKPATTSNYLSHLSSNAEPKDNVTPGKKRRGRLPKTTKPQAEDVARDFQGQAPVDALKSTKAGRRHSGRLPSKNIDEAAQSSLQPEKERAEDTCPTPSVATSNRCAQKKIKCFHEERKDQSEIDKHLKPQKCKKRGPQGKTETRETLDTSVSKDGSDDDGNSSVAQDSVLASIGISYQETLCVHCQQDLKSLDELKIHLMEKHHCVWSEHKHGGVQNLKAVLASMGTISCLTCGRCYTTLQGLSYHMKTCMLTPQTHSKKMSDTSEVKTTDTPTGRSRRKAAQVAMSSFKIRINEEGINDDEEVSDPGDPEVKLSNDSEDEDEELSDTQSNPSAVNDVEFSLKNKVHHKYIRKKYSGLTKGALRTVEMEETWPFYPEDRLELSESEIVYKAKEWYRKHECSGIYPQWVPYTKHWQPGDNLIDITQCTGSIKSQNYGIAHTGSIAWWAAWCPLPQDTKPGSAVTYLAVSCNHDCESGGVAVSSTIQLWDCGPLQDFIDTLQLSYSMVVDEAQIWAIKWCPSGTYMSSLPSKPVTCMQRLGLLAAATSTGLVHILSLPHPDGLCTSGTGRAFRVTPSMTLSLQPLADTLPQCLTMDWSSLHHCQKVCGGYDNGVIAVWSLESTRCTLHKSISQTVLGPMHVFKADLSAITTVCFCPNNDAFLACGGITRMARVYQLGNPNPIQEVQLNRITRIKWPLFWHSVCIGADFLDTNASNNVIQQTFGIENLQRSLLTHKSCVWAIDHSPWLNALAACDSMGHVTTMQQTSVTGRSLDKEVFYKRYLWCVGGQDKGDWLDEPSCESTRTERLLSPLEHSLYTVAWSPNRHSLHWLACGGHNGAVHIKKALVYTHTQ